MKYDAYWISPTGKSSGVKINNIGTVLNNTENFELTKDYLFKSTKTTANQSAWKEKPAQI